MKDAGGKWIGWGPGDSDPKVAQFKAFMRKKFSSYAGGLNDTPTFDAALEASVREMQRRYGIPATGIIDYATQVKMGFITVGPVTPTISIVHFSVNGAGSTWNMGYPFDIGELLDKSKCFHQPIGFNTAPFPMQKGVDDGVNELIRQLNMPRGPRGENCTTIPWCATAYSMGAIVFMTVLMRVLYGDLQQFKSTYRGSSAFGNPMREHGHSFPGCALSDGEGIAKNAHDTPSEHWDFAADKDMEGSPGDDLYSKINKDGDSADQVSDMRAVWEIIRTANPLQLGARLLDLAAKPSFSGGMGAINAALDALNFFVIKGVSPHTTYQFIHPIPGDPRDCWQIALNHMQDIVARS